MHTRLSVAIVTRNRARLLQKCLQSLIRQNSMPYEILIINNFSQDNTARVVQKYKKKLPIRNFLEKQIGIPYARNRALKEARGEIIAFIDDDCKATPTWVEEIIKAHKKHPNAAAIQGKSVSVPEDSIFACIQNTLYDSWIQKNLLKKNHIFVCDTKNVSFKKNVLEDKNITFDPGFLRGSDVDVAKQLVSRGEYIQYVATILIYHYERNTLFTFLKQKSYTAIAQAKLEREWSSDFFPKKIAPKSIQAKLNHLLRNSPKKINHFWLIHTFILYGNIYKLVYTIAKKTCSILRVYNYNLLNLNKKSPYPSNSKKNKIIDTLSIVIITKDRYSSLSRTLHSLKYQTRKPNQVVIIDSSENQLRDVIKKFNKNFNITYVFEKRLGYGIARNNSFKYATGDIIATIDDDGEADLKWCEEIIKSHNLHPDALAIQGRIFSKPIKSSHAIVEQLRIERWFLNNLQFNGRITTLSTKNVSFKNKMLKKFNLKFREDKLYGKYGSEDLDFANKIISAKQNIYYSPQIIIHHSERKNIIDYFKQQYRKGCSNVLIQKTWEDMYKTSKKYYLPKFLTPIIEIICNPVVKDKKNIIPLLFFYYSSLFFYQLGKNNMSKMLKKYPENLLLLEKLTKKRVEKKLIVVVVVKQEVTKLPSILHLLLKQSILPGVIIFIVDHISVETKKIMSELKKSVSNKTKIQCIYEPKEYIKYLSEKRKNILLAILDEYQEIPGNWLEEMIEAHKKYPTATAIQGRIINEPQGNIFATIVQFFYQTFVRNSMIGDRSTYWSWIQGKLQYDYEVLFYSFKNISLKTSLVNNAHLLKQTLHQNKDFEKFLFQQKSHTSLYYPKAYSLDKRRRTFGEFLKGGWEQGREWANASNRLKKRKYPIQNKNFLKQLVAFIYYCFVNLYIFQLPFLIIYFCFYYASLKKGYRYQLRNL